jgi:predicted O-linked N-acetylglucosamine transferase (SPINDLY family)
MAKTASPPQTPSRFSVDTCTFSELLSQVEQATQKGDFGKAIDIYQSWLSVRQDPLKYVIYYNLGVLYGNLKQHDAATEAYNNALALKPDIFQARLNLGHQFENQGQYDQAVQQWQQVLAEISSLPEGQRDATLQIHALNNLGRLLETVKRYDVAEGFLLQSLALDPEQGPVLQHYVHIRQRQCKWPVYVPLAHPTGQITVNRQVTATSALAMLAAYDDPALQLMASKAFVHEKVEPAVPRKPLRQRKPGRLRLAYLSGDICMHAVGLLTVELFELHDKSRFETFAFCWSREDGSPLRQRIVNAFDHFHRIGHLDDRTAAQLIESLDIDVLIDLQGLTQGARPSILSYRPAPVAISYLGLPGTSALPGVQYIVADPFVYPPELEPFMTERPMRVPRCYQVSDRKRSVGPALTRTQCGLPEDRFIFAAFNNNYKFTPEMFVTWMRILFQVPNSVLWVMSDNPWAEENMRNSARALGVDVNRLIFSSRAAPEEYMSRLRLPDLFLDTNPYNAGTTANDILFMGTPILTFSGRTYISRMCGALLTAVGLPDLITTSLQDYERKAVNLGRNPKMIQTYKRYLDEHRLDSDLFNTPQLVRDIEDAILNIEEVRAISA